MRQAQARKQEVMSTINQGKFMVQSQIPFSEIARRFLEARVPQLGVATQGKYRLHIENHIVPAFGKLRMCDIDTPMIETWLNHKLQSGLSWNTCRDLRNILSVIFSKAADWKLWPANQNPCVGAKLGQQTECREKKIPKPEQLRRFLAALKDSDIYPASHTRLIVLTAVIAGTRISEILGLQPRDIDSQAQTIRIQRRCYRDDIAEPKSKKSGACA
jgi:integrase